MRTEASSRFEKGLDVNNAVTAVDRAVQLVAELGAGDVLSGVVDCYPVELKPRTITVEYGKINTLLGTEISKHDMLKILKSVGLETDEANDTVTIPTFRMDIEEMADLAEEVARFYGYNNIKPTLLPGKEMTRGIKTRKQKIEDEITECMLASGLSEIYTYSFTGPDVFDKINLPADSPLRNAVVVSNPLGEDKSIMRTTTIPDMLSVMSRNYNRRIEAARFFELSHTYSRNEPRVSLVPDIDERGLPKEIETLTLGMYGAVDFYNIKGVAEGLMRQLKIRNYSFEQDSTQPTFHPGRTAALLINGERAGVIGEIHPDVLERFEIETKAYVAVIEVEKLILASGEKIQYKALPKYPAVMRDIAMIIKDGIPVKQIEEVIRKKSGTILEELKLFDVYKGKQVPEGMKSVAYSITFRAEDKTLTDEEVNAAMDKIIKGLKTELEAQLRE